MDTENVIIYEVVWVHMHVEYSIFKERFDVTSMLKGLPNDRDPCPHWGTVVKGQMHVFTMEQRKSPTLGNAYYSLPWTHIHRRRRK
jgi:hypothetical protein